MDLQETDRRPERSGEADRPTGMALGARIWRFGVVGLGATAVHTAIGVTLHYGFGIAAFWANAIAFSCAIFVSYFGQTRLTFPESGGGKAAFARFTVVALTGIALNQLIVSIVVQGFDGPYWLALCIIYVTVPVATFVALRYWALRH